MIRQAEKMDAAVLASLACRLWPDHEACEMESEFAGLMEDPEAACFIAYEEITWRGRKPLLWDTWRESMSLTDTVHVALQGIF